MDISIYQNYIAKSCQKLNINFLAVFGSVGRGVANEKSDLDLAISFPDAVLSSERNDISLRIYKELSDLTKRDDIEIVDVENINSALLGAIARDGRALYEKEEGIFSRWGAFAKRSYLETEWLRDLAFRNIKKQISTWESKK